MSNCYDHSIKKNMLDTVYGTRKELKDMLKENRRELSIWYYNEQAKYDRALANFDINIIYHIKQEKKEKVSYEDNIYYIFFVPSFLHYNKK